MLPPYTLRLSFPYDKASSRLRHHHQYSLFTLKLALTEGRKAPFIILLSPRFRKFDPPFAFILTVNYHVLPFLKKRQNAIMILAELILKIFSSTNYFVFTSADYVRTKVERGCEMLYLRYAWNGNFVPNYLLHLFVLLIYEICHNFGNLLYLTTFSMCKNTKSDFDLQKEAVTSAKNLLFPFCIVRVFNFILETNKREKKPFLFSETFVNCYWEA